MSRFLLLLPLLALTACGRDSSGGLGDDPATASDEPAVSACEPDLDLFTTELWEPVLSQQCLACHDVGTGNPASSSAFRLDKADLAASMQAAIAVADRIVDKPTGRHERGHGGGKIVDVGSRDYAALSWWRGYVVDGDCEAPEAWTCEDAGGPRLLRRLTPHEYDRTMSALLRMEVHEGEGFAPDNVVDGFHNDAEALVVDDLRALQYRDFAEKLAYEADLDALLPCSPAAVGRSVCAMQFIEDFGFRAFRRPLTQDDVDRYHALWTGIAEEGGFDEGLRWVIVAMLQSPHTLYRSELGVGDGSGTFRLTDWELASALSYTFWGAPPDGSLIEAAGDGTLSDPEVLDAQIARLAADPRAAETTADMVESWLHLDRLKTVSREGLDADLRARLAQETRDLVIDVAVNGGSLDDLMQSRHSFLDAELASHYGVSGTGRVDLSGTPYGGLLTQGAVLTTHGRHLGSSPVQRGVVVRERMLCDHLPPPPVNVDASPPELDPSASTREHYTQHSADPACSECHDKIDPIGFGFEHFDELGRFRETDGPHEVDDSGDLDGVAFEGPHELADALVDDGRFRACFVETWRRFATGRAACADDPVEVGLMTPLLQLPTRVGFSERVGDPAEGDSLAVGQRIDLDLPDDEVVPDEALTVEASVNDWGGGYCVDITVTNEGAEELTWSVRRDVDGTVSNHWNSTLTDNGDHWLFTGNEHNGVLAPGASAGFGYCANR